MCKVCEMLLGEERKLAEIQEKQLEVMYYRSSSTYREAVDRLHGEEIETLERLSRLHDQWEAEVTHEIVE